MSPFGMEGLKMAKEKEYPWITWSSRRARISTGSFRAPGLIFGFAGDTIAITFRELTTHMTFVGYRIHGLDWTFANAYGVQIDKVRVAPGGPTIKIPPYKPTIKFVGDSFSSGMYTSYESLSNFAYGVGAGLGNTEWYVTAYPGICVSDKNYWGNPRGQSHQWFYTSDTSWRASQIWGDEPKPWDFDKQETIPDIAITNLGTNDINTKTTSVRKRILTPTRSRYRASTGSIPKRKSS
ncbi:hypothetical protein F5B19DRAFT_492750 [Rostrohypoxylon terebratum]|nr:hypothetical protein F5B19DRAFT_492750 [Rostrohypoxylon terebratum]